MHKVDAVAVAIAKAIANKTLTMRTCYSTLLHAWYVAISDENGLICAAMTQEEADALVNDVKERLL